LALFDRQIDLDIGLSTLDHLAFEFPNDQYDQVLARFQSLGMVLRQRSWPDSLDWRARSFFFRDPEGNVIELIAADPIGK
jgi:catechol 2,3-dioxygenase-like lactoylglutathione lyase family enzyme